ncbi:MAG: YihA family ribosome biogenesis GTP-binding protein [Lentimicrobiaceae bacterium]|jgi:GTP-binding protein|nr:YihA family ribosome biogenesis GTP-binding protein [Lentimicrobiaceae bacterium]MCP4910663.1 YihA family ribosome biogenesis GTP-binding protein [Bacteroidota bacterium]MBT3454896.1 YihA family ribosome biogenesis GTP-binding protein [Lentimicrobiaceae bacterium]MBT3818478.1 YihA family ribosome biogenesis GTP-binding protein [Lentimicrobiaceae bacterium]MBT4060846.1 YihA family ribosome biogenesis GTP-binding protein [Lentimicrobiaceae bacterium]
MKINQAEFVISSTDIKQCPKPDKPEYAFIGRSNVGKSSLINMLTFRKKLAKTSSTPGKTILINHFIVNKSWYLVDLPGYGYAKRSKTERQKWEKMIRKYILNRTNMLTLFVLIDSRIEPQQIDLDFIDWLGISNIPFVLTFTKADKLKPLQLATNIENYKIKLLEKWEEVPLFLVTSAVKGDGRNEVLDYIEKTNLIFDPGTI